MCLIDLHIFSKSYHMHIYTILHSNRCLMHTLILITSYVYSGGRLIYLIPTTYDFEVSDLPLHPCLDLGEVGCIYDIYVI